MARKWLPIFASLLVFTFNFSTALAQDGLVLIWGEDTDYAQLDPRVTQSRHEAQVIHQIFDQLIYADENNQLFPGLAESWEVSDDRTSYTLTLRQDVTFHDGTRFNAEAVKFTFDTIQDPALGSQSAIDTLGPYQSSEVIENYVVQVNFTRPFPDALLAFAQQELSIVSPTAVETLGDGEFARNPVGTGPFRFVSWDSGRQVVLERNPEYNWAPEFFGRQGASEVERIVFRIIPEASTRVAALEAGEINIADEVPPLDILTFEALPQFGTMVAAAPGIVRGVLLNTSRGPLEDVRVRQAFMYAVDREELVERLYFGVTDVAYGPITSTTPQYWSGVEDYYLYSPEQAIRLLEEAGWTDINSEGIREKDGQPLSLFMAIIYDQETGIAIQDYVAQVGIDLQVELMLANRRNEFILANEYDMSFLGFISPSPTVLATPFHSRNIPEPGSFSFNWARYSDPDLDELIEAGESATSEEEQSDAYQRAQQMIMEAALYFPLHNSVQAVAYDSSLTGLRFVNNYQVHFYGVTQVIE